MRETRDNILIPHMNYIPTNMKHGKVTVDCVNSPDGVLMIEFDTDPIKVCILKESMCHTKLGYLESARPHLEKIVELLNPDKILNMNCEDVTSTLYIR